MFRDDFGPTYKTFYNIQSNFFSDVRPICCVHQGDFCERSDGDVFQLILYANTAAFFCSLLGLDPHSF